VFRFAGFELDRERAELRGPDGEAIRLRPKALEMLQLFAANAGRVLSKEELMEAVWPNVHVGEDSLFQCIREIRTALGDDRRQTIKLVSGRGYLFAVEVSIERSAPAVAVQASVEPIARAKPATEVEKPRRLFGLPRPAVVAAGAALCVIFGFAVAAPTFRPDLMFKRSPPTIAVTPIVDASNDPAGAGMAATVTDRLTDGLARIDNIRVVAPRPVAAATALTSTPSAQSDFVLNGELEKGPQSWVLRARMIQTATGEVQSVATVSVDVTEPDMQLQQSRLAAGAGHALARRLNALLDIRRSSGRGRRRQSRDRASHSFDQPNDARTFCHGTDDAGKSAHRRAGQYRAANRAGSASVARDSDGVVRAGRARSGGAQRRIIAGARAADHATLHSGPRSLLPLPDCDQPIR
jgi:DNA-binding winged helix-turn-helix (wHTH) protein/TolB-like protein